MKKSILSEKHIVVILFVTAFVIFSFAHEDTKKIERMYPDPALSPASLSETANPETTVKIEANKDLLPASLLR